MLLISLCRDILNKIKINKNSLKIRASKLKSASVKTKEYLDLEDKYLRALASKQDLIKIF